MLAHDRYDTQQAYGDYDEYESEEGEEEEEEEEDKPEEDAKPTQEVLDFLKLREKFKEKIRQKYKKENAAALGPTGSLAKSGTTTDTKFGSFFGPSQRVIAPRVIEESRSMREAKHIVSKAPSSTSSSKPVSSKTVLKSFSNGKPRKVVNELKRKVQTLKETRDYSFLLSDDADLPVHAEPPSKNVSVSNSGASSSRPPQPPKMSMSKPGKPTHHSQLSNNSISSDQHVQKKSEHPKTLPPSRPKSSSSEPRKPMEGKGHGRLSQPLASKSSSQAAKQVTIAKHTPATQVTVTRQAPATQVPITRQAPTTQVTVTRQTSALGTKRPSNMERAPLLSKTHSTAQNKFSEQRKKIQDVSRGKLLPKQAISNSKPQLSKPSKQIPQHNTHEERPKQKCVKSCSRNPFDDDDDDIDDPMSFLRNKLLSRYNSSKYHVDDDDDSDMEANFDDIMKEERRSSKIARQEDDEQLRLIEEEERREKMRRETKRRKLMQR